MESPKKLSIGLVLSGGGGKGAYEIGIIRDARAERAQNILIIISMQSLHERPLW